MESRKVVLVDTDIFIKVFRGDNTHKRRLDSLAGHIAVSFITVMELYQGANSKKRKYELEKQLRAYNIIHLNDEISKTALFLLKKYLPDQKLSPPDCLIAATSLASGYKLYTDNTSDFDFIKDLKFYSK